jgi:ABC-2 type transport system permease protein
VLFPPALYHRALNAIAATDLESHVAYLDSVLAYHESLQRWYFPAIFDNRPISQMEWWSAPGHRHHATTRHATFATAAQLMMVVVIVLASDLVRVARASAPPSARFSRSTS